MMLPTEEFELAILDRLLDSSDRGVSWSLGDYGMALHEATGRQATNPEIVDMLVTLLDNKLITIKKIAKGQWSHFDITQDTVFFYQGDFTCSPTHRARRRREELQNQAGNGVFISHKSSEGEFALKLKSLLDRACQGQLSIFVSSDYDSIEDGEEWYGAILAGIKRARIMICLLSSTSVDSRWINFEAGVATGQGMRVIPLVYAGLNKGDIGNPLGKLHARSLNDPAEVRALLERVAKEHNIHTLDPDIGAFTDEIRLLEAKAPTTSLRCRVFLKDSVIHLAIRNFSNRPLHLLYAQLLIPKKLTGSNIFRTQEPVRKKITSGDDQIGHQITSEASHIPNLGISPIPKILTSPMGEILIPSLRIALPPTLSSRDELLEIEYHVVAEEEGIGPVRMKISDIPRL